ncbi:MAG: pilus assembly protein [Pseudolabrys sp.]|nr:pilus assembly protein [Pseudolabrys sp.]MBV9261063.1 pilus assembly protein [Pseudolabrys sp.]
MKFMKRTQRDIAVAVRCFVRHKKGAAAIEFGLVAVPFIALIFAIMETALVFFAGQSLEAAVATSGRLVMTGQAQNGNWSQSQFKTQVCNTTSVLFDCANKLYVNVQNFSDFTSATATPPYNNGQLDTTKMQYQPGTQGSIVVVQLYYQWPIYVSLLSNNLSNQNGGNRLLIATAAFKNEPY